MNDRYRNNCIRVDMVDEYVYVFFLIFLFYVYLINLNSCCEKKIRYYF